MMLYFLFTLILSVSTVLGSSDNSSGKVFCYWGAWANTRPGIGAYGASDLPTDICTHIVYSFLFTSAEGEITVADAESIVDGKSSYFADALALKENNTDLKFMFSVGGWTAGSVNFSSVSNNDAYRANFVSNAVNFVVDNNYDGLDIDWEYPAQRGGNESDYEAYIWLLRDLKEALSAKGLLLSTAVSPTQANADISYNITGVSTYVDYVVLMTYDFHLATDSVTGVNAPLYQQLNDAADSVLNANASVYVWLDAGADPSKLLLGIASYGHSYELASLDDTSTNANSTGAGPAGPYSQEAGTLAYFEICMDLQANSTLWNVTEVTGNYVYGNKDLLWIGYDNPNTIYAKGQYAKEKGLAGVSLWAIDLDDFSAQCGTKYPIISAAKAGYIAG